MATRRYAGCYASEEHVDRDHCSVMALERCVREHLAALDAVASGHWAGKERWCADAALRLLALLLRAQGCAVPWQVVGPQVRADARKPVHGGVFVADVTSASFLGPVPAVRCPNAVAPKTVLETHQDIQNTWTALNT